MPCIAFLQQYFKDEDTVILENDDADCWIYNSAFIEPFIINITAKLTEGGSGCDGGSLWDEMG